MPELPEVENMRRSLESVIKRQRIKHVTIRWGKIVSGRGNRRKASVGALMKFRKGVQGRKIEAIQRRGKNVIFILDDDGRIVVHPKMSGRFVYYANGNEYRAGIHDHVVFQLTSGILVYNDPRKFGYVLYFPRVQECETFFNGLGVEPLSAEFTSSYLRDSLSGRRGRIKTLLLSQSVVAGLGNIYCDEALFQAGVKPTRPSGSLNPVEVRKLHRAIGNILKKAIALGGSTVLTYRTMWGKEGRFTKLIKVYGRAGEICSRCGIRLEGMRINNRATVYCSRCQS